MADVRLSDRILDRCAPVLNTMLEHRFVEDVCADAVPADVFDRYLAYEGAFVDTAISIFALAVARAPDIESRRHLIGVLDALANVQISYFETQFAARDVGWDTKLHPQAAIFRDGMAELAANGSFLDIVTAMFAAEWMYWSWCRRAISLPISNSDLRAWVALHTEDDFAEQALWLKNAIDRYGSDAELDQLSAIFTRVTELEIIFHHAPYEFPHDT
ncbi:thiaminase (transcriptional activator TenA) [Jannaschia faecimaris]|uniref:Aminopyrimidine aminohydrolase n=1 Tax=Jannaschia faecimaris TaxID=1244108 RepID=A0A1H3U6J2_9RHOB|nr:TenA family protein [Jannaschia faecimaris]SDZ57139.1 thiaminase (transcriptional activator TenA) [Jannaschia faecimaris]